MINSRRIEDLHPKVQPLVRAFEAHADEVLKPQGIDLLITSTYRDHASQQALFDQGRTKPGKIVTNARPGQSFHNWRCAIDIALLYFGKTLDPKDDFLMWDNTPERVKLWQAVGVLGELNGLEWAGRWKGGFREMAHFQQSFGLTIADFQSGKQIT